MPSKLSSVGGVTVARHDELTLVGRPARRDRMNLRGWDALIVDLSGAP